MRLLCFNTFDILSEIKIDKKENIISYINTFDERSIKRVYVWKHDNITLECYGCDTNENNEKINSHILPSNENIYTLYGNIYLVSKINNSITDLDISQYGMLSYYIQEKYDTMGACEYIDNTESEEDTDEEPEEEKNLKESPEKNAKYEKQEIVEELEYDNTNY